MDFSTVVTSPELAISLLVGVFLPTVVALVTKRVASPAVKSVVLLVLSAVSTSLVQLLANDDFTLASFVNGFIATFSAAVVAHKGALEPLNITGKDGKIQVKVPGGIGKVVATVDEHVDFTKDDTGVAPVVPPVVPPVPPVVVLPEEPAVEPPVEEPVAPAEEPAEGVPAEEGEVPVDEEITDEEFEDFEEGLEEDVIDESDPETGEDVLGDIGGGEKA